MEDQCRRVPQDAELTDGETIEITRAYPIAVQSGGNTEVMYLSSGTVGDALDKAGVTVKSGDEISELTFRDLEPGMKIAIPPWTLHTRYPTRPSTTTR